MNTFGFTSLLIFATLSLTSANIEILPKGYGGVEVQPHSIPFIVSLVYQSKELNVSFCSGSLLNEHWVLTASNCLQVYPDFYVVAGQHSLDSIENSTQVRKAFALFQHPIYYIGLIYVKEPFNITKDVGPVTTGELNPNATIKIQGWGSSLSSKVRIYPVNLRSTSLSVVSLDQCNATYPNDLDEDINFCAADPSRETCVEQSGGPVLQDGVQVGIASWKTRECEITPEPSVFIKIAHCDSWIQGTISQPPMVYIADNVFEADKANPAESKAAEEDLIQVNVNPLII